MLNFYSLCERFICQAKTFFFSFSLFLHEKRPLCGSQLVPTLLVLLTLFFRVPEYSLFTCTYVRIFHCHRQRFWPQKVSALSAHSNPNSNLHILLATTSFGNSFLVRDQAVAIVRFLQLLPTAGVFLTIFMSFAQLYGKAKWPKVRGSVR